MNHSFFFRTLWRWGRWVLLAVVVAYAGLVIYRLPHAADVERTQATVAEIHATKLTRDDVLGTLPPPPDQTLNDSTIAGVDANHNGIRDDVEIAIYNAHKDSASVTAAEYQYAMAIQLMLTDVYNTDTWVAAARAESAASYCISETYSKTNLVKFNQVINERDKEVESLMLNTPSRQATYDDANKFTTTFELPNSNQCDIDLNTLPN